MKINISLFTIFSIVFILMMPCVFMLFLNPQNNTLSSENRALAKIPKKITFQLPMQIEEFFNDRLPAREFIISHTQKLINTIFPLYDQQVTIGKDHFLFYTPHSRNNPLDLYRGAITYREYDVMEVISYFETMRINACNNGADFLVLIPPNKVDIYFDKLPEKRHYKRYSYSFLDRLQQEIKEKHPAIKALFLEAQMIQNKARIEKTLYFCQDTHWNFVGSYCAMFALLNKLGLPPPPTWPEISNATYDILPNFDAGDLRRMMGRNAPKFTENVEIVQMFSHPSYERKEIEGHNAFVTLNANAYDLRTVVIFRDSFCIALVPYLSSYFRQIYYYWEPYQAEVVQKHSPDLVIWERVSRAIGIYNNPRKNHL